MHLLALNPLFLVDVTISPVFREKIFFSILEAAFRMQPELTHAILTRKSAQHHFDDMKIHRKDTLVIPIRNRSLISLKD